MYRNGTPRVPPAAIPACQIKEPEGLPLSSRIQIHRLPHPTTCRDSSPPSHYISDSAFSIAAAVGTIPPTSISTILWAGGKVCESTGLHHKQQDIPDRPAYSSASLLAPWWKLEIGIGKSGKKIRPVPPVGNTPTRRPLRMVQLKGSDTGAPFQGLPRMEDQQKIPWKKVRMQMRRCKDQFQIRNLFTDERWILQFLSSTAVERWMPATDEEDIESQVSEWELKERE
ncbi:hypothetical protein BZA05DRAFT_445627 [Tricharina praecox]|uniref:uncharacterized protein n=1 Tax=Tricharina praecox TaxID=43433 RepID=UPI00221E3803|nr:uncharacterized protein BZA05DRAFT_445627 [Tricharina praecox]KAI5850789.1 hypothetical protein BZA05DRAFT_445627 [Tricharina praecox]